ncbi:MAG: membrane protein insertase YidC, partial [Planctomycetes bacterium]|nr:membrane protein insertase YidC [Planctomycetota bacterium]
MVARRIVWAFVTLAAAGMAGMALLSNRAADERTSAARRAISLQAAAPPEAAPAEAAVPPKTANEPAAAPPKTTPAAPSGGGRVSTDGGSVAAARSAPAGGRSPGSSPHRTTRPAGPAVAAAGVAPAEWVRDTSGLGRQDHFLAGSLDPASGYLFQVEFVREGAAINTLKLANAFATDADKRLFYAMGRDHARYEAARLANPRKYRGHYSLLNPAGQYRPYATRRIAVTVAGTAGPPGIIRLDAIPWRHTVTRAATGPAEGVEVRFETTLWRDMNHGRSGAAPDYRPVVKLTKSYLVRRGDYSLEMRLELRNLLDVPIRVYVDQLGPTGVPLEELWRASDDRFLPYGRLEQGSSKVQVVQKMQREITKRRGGQYVLPSGKPVPVGRSDDPSPVLWIGLANKFFASMMYLRPQFAQRLAAVQWQADFNYLAVPESPTSRTYVAAVRVGGKRIQPDKFAHSPAMLLTGGQVRRMVFDVFAGPKKREMFSSPGAAHYRPLYGKLNYIGTISLRSCFCAWDGLTLGMMWLLQWISRHVAFGNYGVAIMILVFLVRLVLHPLTRKSQVNMMKMQELAPEMAKLKKKFGDDKEKFQKEMMAFYKKQGATPLLGCLPMLLQMPIWISLWGSLNAAVELRHAAFLPVWITDLAAPDALVRWSGAISLPLVGGLMGPLRSFNLLPLLLTVAMFLQT